ncbi:MAG TPA: hypothetical protein VKO67_07075 [Smithellaceae bacterium]|nr:hypothetical protein [Smithellaceae bacterium]
MSHNPHADFMSDLRIQDVVTKWFESMGSEVAKGFLRLLLKLMAFVFMLNIKDFRKNIESFNGRYVFRSKDNSIVASAAFENGTMKVYDRIIEKPNMTITFRNDRSLMNYLLSPKPDILNAVLKQDVTVSGNLNYLYKFAYMAKRLQLMATGKV